MPRSMPSHTRDEKTGSSYLDWLVGVDTVSWRFGRLAEEEEGGGGATVPSTKRGRVPPWREADFL